MEKLRTEGKNKYFTKTKKFEKTQFFKPSTVLSVFDFAYKMTFGNEGEHRNHRSGGTHNRKLGEIFADTFQGKLSEFAVYNTLYKDFEMAVPDLEVWKLGKWDDVDLIAGDLMSGVARAFDAGVTAVSIACGVGIVLDVWLRLGGVL